MAMRTLSAGQRYARQGAPAVVSASVPTVEARQISKTIGSNILVSAGFTPGTRNSQGSLITWPYRVRVVMIQQRTLSSDIHLEEKSSAVINQASGTVTTTLTFTTPNISDRLKFDVHVDARTSNPDGTPSATWTEVAFQAKADAVQPAPGVSNPDAQISSINVSNLVRGQFAFPAPAGRPFEYGAAAAQGRPAGGFAFPEALVPPNMDVRQLPGPGIRLPRV